LKVGLYQVRQKIVLFLLVAIVLAVGAGIALLGKMFYTMWEWSKWLDEMQAKMGAVEYYEEAGRELALYCQSVEREIDDYGIGKMLFPEIIWELNPIYGSVSPELAEVNVGGGFCRLGYWLEQNKSESSDDENTWDLYIYTETTQTKIYSFRLNKEERIAIQDIIDSAVKGYDREMGLKPNDIEVHKAKILYLLKFGQREASLEASRKVANEFMDHWWGQLARALLEAEAGDSTGAGERFSQWADTHAGFTNYFYLCYFYYQENLSNEFAEAAAKALKQSINRAEHDEHRIEHYGLLMAMYAYELEQYEKATEICELMERSRREEEQEQMSNDDINDLRDLKDLIRDRDSTTIEKLKSQKNRFNPFSSWFWAGGER